MINPQKRRRKPTLLSSTRPPHSRSSTLSSRATRTLIRTHHTIQKRLSTALLAQNAPLATSLQSQLEASGGLAKYQKASLIGQSPERGGDSSRVLAAWVEEVLHNTLSQVSGKRESITTSPLSLSPPTSCRWRMLDVGALQADNAIARTHAVDIERIDLHSQHPSIKTQDFMQRPLPTDPSSFFDIVSLSLVLNYVGDAKARGEMLRRVRKFLRLGPPFCPPPPPPPPPHHHHHNYSSLSSENSDIPIPDIPPFFPGLFLVLPKPCVTNSRYLDEERLEAMMAALGYVRTRRKITGKLIYYFWRLVGEEREGMGERLGEIGKEVKKGKGTEKIILGSKPKVEFRKEEIRKGPGRNNFAIVLV